MKVTNLSEILKSPLVPSHVREIALGTIAVNSVSLEPIESQVVISENNFKLLLTMLPKSTHNRLNNDLASIKLKLDRLTNRSDLSRKMIADTLMEHANFQMFLSDVEEYDNTFNIEIDDLTP